MKTKTAEELLLECLNDSFELQCKMAKAKAALRAEGAEDRAEALQMLIVRQRETRDYLINV